ncbi:hypothetical protein diail_5861 [Diaporthe ilicicola]|nr:hypothetical protein diail_5861 [Diaporthe ilicicola]
MRNLHTSRTSSSKEPATSSGRMPYDRSSTAAPSSSSSSSSAPSRHPPHAPSLAKRLPVTPKLAGKPAPISSASTSASASQRQTVTLATPVPRRSARPSSVVSHGAATAGASRHEHASPVPNHLQNNATPRSGSRQSRVTSANASPSPADAAAADHWETRSGLGISGSALDSDTGSGGLQRNESAPAPRESKFFYASDASKTTQSATPAPRPAPPQKGPTFFYANGNNLPPKPSPPTSVPSAPFSPLLAASTSDPLASKFMYANGSADLQPSLMKSGPGSALSTTSRTTATKPSSGSQSPAHLSQRIPSPAKTACYPPPPHPQAHPQGQGQVQPSAGPSIAERRSMLTSAPQLGRVNSNESRRTSAEATPRRVSGHSRSGSLVAEPPSVVRTVVPSSPVSSPVPSPLTFSNPAISMASVLEAADELAGSQDDSDSIVSGLASPKSASGNDPLNELVANARRERKVQDLQITNASLEAINRTLERQLRKQTNELRRYKRLTRAGRLASANTAASSRIASASTASEAPEGPLNNLGLADLSEDDSEAEAEDDCMDESELSESDSAGSAQMSPSTLKMREASHMKRDERRLQVDLSKHQQLLVDSQKMNQSLKRCLGWTEELIREGKRALEYQVRVSEFDVEGRAMPEEGEQPYIYDGAQLWDHSSDQHRASSSSEYGQSDGDDDQDPDETMKLRIERLRPAENETGAKSTQDRDSGIVLSGDGS